MLHQPRGGLETRCEQNNDVASFRAENSCREVPFGTCAKPRKARVWPSARLVGEMTRIHHTGKKHPSRSLAELDTANHPITKVQVRCCGGWARFGDVPGLRDASPSAQSLVEAHD